MNINYTLAKELKDAGFPQLVDAPRTGAQAYTHDGELIEYDDSFWRNGEPAYCVPNLEELIEACGDRELDLKKYLSSVTDKYEWRAIVPYQEPIGFGPTPNEAVARLWLALNAK